MGSRPSASEERVQRVLHGIILSTMLNSKVRYIFICRMIVVPACGWWRLEDGGVKIILGYKVSSS